MLDFDRKLISQLSSPNIQQEVGDRYREQIFTVPVTNIHRINTIFFLPANQKNMSRKTLKT